MWSPSPASGRSQRAGQRRQDGVLRAGRRWPGRPRRRAASSTSVVGVPDDPEPADQLEVLLGVDLDVRDARARGAATSPRIRRVARQGAQKAEENCSSVARSPSVVAEAVQDPRLDVRRRSGGRSRAGGACRGSARRGRPARARTRCASTSATTRTPAPWLMRSQSTRPGTRRPELIPRATTRDVDRSPTRHRAESGQPPAKRRQQLDGVARRAGSRRPRLGGTRPGGPRPAPSRPTARRRAGRGRRAACVRRPARRPASYPRRPATWSDSTPAAARAAAQ